MTVNSTRLRTHIQNFRFEDLFIDELGWDQYRTRLDVIIDGRPMTLNAFAEKRGMVALMIPMIPEYKIRRKIEQQVAKTYRENILIYTDQTRQIWQWVRRETGKPLANRERQFTTGQSGENIAQILAGIAFSLDEEDSLTIVDVTSRVKAAFDMERVTKKFYDRFKKQHDAFLKFIEGIPDEDLQRWYASVMLNRLMFIYFVQRKGFLDGDTDYLRNRLAQTGGNFYRDFLCPLFFDGFARKAQTPETRHLLGDVPYLNGGLFLQHQIEELYGDAIQIENDAFKKLFDFFDEYHWHLDERPLRSDNEINPDVLGYIFEKYINQKQMGAYYTKEDITEYIGKNTIIPFLFDEARKAVKIAFEGDHTVWDLLKENPDRYIYPAVRHGTEHALPAHIAAGLNQVSQRGQWNTPAPSDYALPTEIWRETVARRARYEEVRGKLERGEVRQINDLITLNLDIQQFAQDVIDFTDSADVIRAFWKAINRMTVLDPTCGSGAFLFAALNILEPLYEACLERMEAFLAEIDRVGGGHPQKYSDFREVMARIDQHPNRRYFILKSIIIQNLYGVDIMEEAVEIAKLRLFLKLMAQVDDKRRIEPLPDIDFNIRAGNTLVGFATQEEVRRAMTTTSGGQGKLLFAEDLAALEEIERKAGDIDRLFGRFRQQQTELGGEVRPEDKAELKRRLAELEDELNRLLAGQYGIDAARAAPYEAWRKSHEPFHWFIEFYGVLKSGGFDVIIGNPPYVEYSKIKKAYTINGFATEKAGNLYAMCTERFVTLCRTDGLFGEIVPLSGFSSARMEEYQRLFMERLLTVYISYFSGDAHPSVLFDGVKYRLCVIVGKVSKTTTQASVFVSDYYRFYADERGGLFDRISYIASSFSQGYLRFAKAGTLQAQNLLTRLMSNKRTLSAYLVKKNEHILLYHRSPNFWIRAMDFEPYFKSPTRNKSEDHVRDLFVAKPENIQVIGAILSSSLFYFWFITQGNCRNLTGENIDNFPVGDINREISDELRLIYAALMNDVRKNAKRRIIEYKLSGLVEYDEYYLRPSKHIIDEIDRVLARHYGFTDEELDFIINYDIKYRMGDDLGGDEDEE